jgi:hypothetical protein
MGKSLFHYAQCFVPWLKAGHSARVNVLVGINASQNYYARDDPDAKALNGAFGYRLFGSIALGLPAPRIAFE